MNTTNFLRSFILISKDHSLPKALHIFSVKSTNFLKSFILLSEDHKLPKALHIFSVKTTNFLRSFILLNEDHNLPKVHHTAQWRQQITHWCHASETDVKPERQHELYPQSLDCMHAWHFRQNHAPWQQNTTEKCNSNYITIPIICIQYTLL